MKEKILGLINDTPKNKVKFTNMPVITDYKIFNSLFIDSSNNKLINKILKILIQI